VKRIFYLCRQGALARLDPSFEMDLMRRFGEGREDEPVSLLVRFRGSPDDKDKSFVEAAGFVIDARTDSAWVVTGPLRFLQRLLASDRIIYYEGASKARTK
jgi:hypothetical protein